MKKLIISLASSVLLLFFLWSTFTTYKSKAEAVRCVAWETQFVSQAVDLQGFIIREVLVCTKFVPAKKSPSTNGDEFRVFIFVDLTHAQKSITVTRDVVLPPKPQEGFPREMIIPAGTYKFNNSENAFEAPAFER